MTDFPDKFIPQRYRRRGPSWASQNDRNDPKFRRPILSQRPQSTNRSSQRKTWGLASESLDSLAGLMPQLRLLRCNALCYIVLKSSQAERIFQQLEQKFTGGNRENGVGFDPEAQFGHGFFRGSRRWSRILKYHPDIFDHGWARIYTDGLGAQSVSIREIRGFNCRFRDSSASSAASCKIRFRGWSGLPIRVHPRDQRESHSSVASVASCKIRFRFGCGSPALGSSVTKCRISADRLKSSARGLKLRATTDALRRLMNPATAPARFRGRAGFAGRDRDRLRESARARPRSRDRSPAPRAAA